MHPEKRKGFHGPLQVDIIVICGLSFPNLPALPLTPKRNNLTRTFLTKWLPTCTLLALFILGWVLFTLSPRWIIQFLRIPYRPTGTHKVFLLSQGWSSLVNGTIYFYLFLEMGSNLRSRLQIQKSFCDVK